MEGTRLSILQLLQKKGNDTVEGLAWAIGLAPATIRRHLDILQRDRMVAFREVRKKTGRPEYSFYLTEQGQEVLPKSYDLLLRLVLGKLAELTCEDTHDRDGKQLLELLFRRVSDEFWRQHEDKVAGKDPRSRVNALATLLEEKGFSAEVEVSDRRLRIRLTNCPFRSVALLNRSVCSFDANLLSAMLNVKLTRERCIQDGDPGCVYTGLVAASQSTADFIVR